MNSYMKCNNFGYLSTHELLKGNGNKGFRIVPERGTPSITAGKDTVLQG